MPPLADLAARTAQKLEYARLNLHELESSQHRHSGDSWERCHLESVLFHFYGAVDAFLQELNEHYGCGLALNKVYRRTLKQRLDDTGQHSTELDAIETVENTQGSYLWLAKEMRNFVTHRGGLPMAHYFNGPSNLVHPVTRQEFNVDSIALLESWIEELEKLLAQLRAWS